MERETQCHQIRLMTRQRESMTNFWQLWPMSSDLARLLKYRSQCASNTHTYTVRSADACVICNWLARQTTGKHYSAHVRERWPSEISGFLFLWCFDMWNITSVYLSVHTHCYCYKILALWPYVLERTHAQSNNQRAYPNQQEVKLYLADSQLEYWESVTKIYYSRTTVHQPKITATQKQVLTTR